jgi:hypothetical protein
MSGTEVKMKIEYHGALWVDGGMELLFIGSDGEEYRVFVGNAGLSNQAVETLQAINDGYRMTIG